MADDDKPWTPQPMEITITDKGQTMTVANVDRWIEERKQLLRRARDILREFDGTPRSLYKHHGTLIDITRRIAQIKAIFDLFNRERTRHADANIMAMVAFYQDSRTMEGIDD